MDDRIIVDDQITVDDRITVDARIIVDARITVVPDPVVILSGEVIDPHTAFYHEKAYKAL